MRSRSGNPSASSLGDLSPEGKGAVAGGFSGAGVVAWRYRAQKFAEANPSTVPRAGRLGALVSASGTGPRTVGAGVRASISAIHLLAGSAGEAHIGHVFNSSVMQQWMRQSAFSGNTPSAANWHTAQAEHGYWGSQMRGRVASVAGQQFPAVSGFGARAGGVAGWLARPTLRVGLQSIAALAPRTLPAAAALGVIGVGTAMGAGAMRTFPALSAQGHH